MVRLIKKFTNMINLKNIEICCVYSNMSVSRKECAKNDKNYLLNFKILDYRF